MPAEKDEDEQIRSVALQNAQSILAARQRAERELLADSGCGSRSRASATP
jgi:hypothetical protein